MKTSFAPSGDQFGCRSLFVPDGMIGSTRLVRTLTEKSDHERTPGISSRLEKNAIVLPSGDQEGPVSVAEVFPLSRVRRRKCLPSEPTTNNCSVAVRDVNKTFVKAI